MFIRFALILLAVSGCSQDPIPINPTPAAPCGVGAYQECPDHGCCLAYTQECTAQHMCRDVGESPTFGAARDGGTRERPELTPEEARKSGKPGGP